ncbi:MAG: S-adenosyl-L-methionine-dependent methyltransferase [Frankiales bacterium]|nr:S-adenosyl-L-methionine-dependent methyltransferase [Frankiales bacterium]
MTVGREQGSLLLRTVVEGKAARTGHELTLLVTSWECRTEVDGDTPVSVELRAQLPSLEVLNGEGGVKPLSDRDKRSIKDNALRTLKADRNPQSCSRAQPCRPRPAAGRCWGTSRSAA